MKTLNQKTITTLENSDSVIERLTFAIIKHGVPVEDFAGIANNSADAGWPAISYYNDTCEFYNANKEAIWDYATEQAEELGNANVFEMIAGFRRADVGSCNQFENLMTWYIAEEVSRYCVDTFKVPAY